MVARMPETPTTLPRRCEPCLRRTAFQLALCYTLGFGVPADHEKVVYYMASSGKTESDLHVGSQANIGIWIFDLQSRPAKLVDNGIIVIWDFVDDYRRKGLKLTEVLNYHLRKLIDMEKVLGNDSDTVRMLKAVLAKIYALEEDFKNVKRLRRELLQTSISKFGDQDLDTLYAKKILGVVLLGTGELTEAGGLLHSAFAGISGILGENHLATLTAQARWCDTLHMRGLYVEAMHIYRGIYYKIYQAPRSRAP